MDVSPAYICLCMSVLIWAPNVCSTCAVPIEAQRRHQIPENWRYRQLRTAMWLLEIKTGSSPRTVIFPAP